MRLFYALLIAQPGTANKLYVDFPTPPTFSDTNTIAPSGNQTVNSAALGGKTDQLVSPGQAAGWTLNNIGGTESTPVRFRSQSSTNRAIIGDGTITNQRCIRTLNTVLNVELYDLILYENQGGISLSGSGESTPSRLYVQNIEGHRHTFAGLWCNTGNGHYREISSAFMRFFDLDGGAGTGVDGGEGYYLGNTSQGSRSLIYTSKHKHIYLDGAAREGLQITSVFDLLMEQMTIRNSGTWGASGTGQNRMGQFQHSNGIVRDTIWDDAASSFECFTHGLTFYNNYFRWTNADRFYIGDPEDEPQLNGEPLIFDNCIFKSTSGSNPLLFVAMSNADVIVRNCVISNNISSLFTDNRGGGPSNSLIDGGGNTFVSAASIPDPTYMVEPGFDLHLTYVSTGAMTADQANQTAGRRYLVGTTYYTKKTTSAASLANDYIITAPAMVVTSNYHYNRFMGYRTPPDPIQPTDVALDDLEIDEGNSVNAVIGTLSTIGGSGSYTYSVVDNGYGSEDFASFNISGSNLRATDVFDVSTQEFYNVRIRATSTTNSMRYVEKPFVITIIGAPSAATDITLSNDEVDELVAVDTLVGTFSDDSYPGATWSLVSGTGSTDNASFSIVGNQLRIQVIPDYETKSSYAIRVRSTNTSNGALTYEEQFTITINNISEGVEDEYQDILDEATSQGYTAPSGAQQVKQNAIIVALKNAGVWSKLDALWVFTTDGDSTFTYMNWKNPTGTKMVPVGSPVFTGTNQGWRATSTANYINTQFALSSATQFTQNDCSYFVGGVGPNAAASGTFFGAYSASSIGTHLFRFTNNSVYTCVNNTETNSAAVTFTNTYNMFFVNRAASGSYTVYKNNTLADTVSVASVARATQPLAVACLRTSAGAGTLPMTTGYVSFLAIGGALDSTQRTDFYTAMNTYISNP